MADENLFRIELVTPERVLITGSASEVILRTGRATPPSWPATRRWWAPSSPG